MGLGDVERGEGDGRGVQFTVVTDTTSWGRLFHSAIVCGENVLRAVIGKVIPNVMGLPSVCFLWTG